MKRVIVLVIAMISAICLIACGDGQEMSEKKYQQLMSDMGIEGMENVVENVMLEAVLYDKTDGREYRYGCYALGEDENQALAMREEYINYLQEQGYEYLSADDTRGDTYIKGNYAVVVHYIIGPVSWSDKSEGQYGLYLWFE